MSASVAATPGQRKRLPDDAAESIARIADEIEAAAIEVRQYDKQTALWLQRKAEKLHAAAKSLSTDKAKRVYQSRAKHEQKKGIPTPSWRERHGRHEPPRCPDWQHAPRKPTDEWWEN